MGKRIIDGETKEGAEYLIQPKNINSKSYFWDEFVNYDTEVSAKYIVELCQKAGGWIPFTQVEINEHSRHDFCFNELCEHSDDKDDRNLVILGEDGRYRVTHEFIATCFKSSPEI